MSTEEQGAATRIRTMRACSIASATRRSFSAAMGGFRNFAISFTIISILAGCLTSYTSASSTAARCG